MTQRTVVVNVTANVAPAVAGLNATSASANKLAAAQAHLAGAQAKSAAGMTATGAAARGAAPAVAGAATGLRGMAAATGLLNPALLGGAGLIAGLKGTVGAAIAWETAFTGVEKTVDGTAAQMSALSDGLRNLSTEIPTNANDLAAIAESAGQLGIETGNILGFTRTMADLGEATNMSGEQAATAFARFANITQMSQGDFDRLGSTVVDLGNNLATTEAEISEFGLRLAGAGAQVGLSEAEILGLGGALSSVGINAEAGGTAVSKVMIDMAKAVSEGGDQLGLFAETAGMSAQQFATSFRDDPAAAIAAFIEGLGGIDAAGGDLFATLEELGITEQRMRDAMLRTAGAGTLVADSMNMANNAWAENVALAEEAERRYGTIEGQWGIFKNRLTDARVEIGEQLTPAVVRLLDHLNQSFEPGGLMTIGDTVNEQVRSTLAPLDEFGSRLNGAIREMVGVEEQAVFVAEALGGMTRAGADAWSARLQGQADAYASSLQGVAAAAIEAEQSHEDALEALEAYIDGQRAAVDPVFALESALGDVEQAQRDYDAAVKEHGANSQEAADANWTHLRSIADLEAAALDGLLSFDRFSDKLDEWVDGGRITAEQADRTRARVADLRGEAENAAGDYDLHIILNNWREASEQLDGVERRAIAASQDRSLTITADTAAALRDLRALEAVARRTGSQIAGVTGRGGFTQHTGGYAGTGPWRRYHSGGLASDEIPAILQRGEFVVRRDVTEKHGALLEALNARRFHSGGAATGAVGNGAGFFDLQALFGMTVGPSGQGAQAHLASIRDMEAAYARMSDELERQETLAQRAALWERYRTAETEDRADALEAIREFDQAQAIAHERRLIADRISQAQANQRLTVNREAYEFERMTADEQVARLDRQIAAERRYTDEWMRLVSQRTSILEGEADAARQSYDEQFDALNRMLDDRSRLVGQQADAEADYGRATADLRRSYAEQTADAEVAHLERVADAERALADQVVAARRRTADAIRSTVDARRSELAAGFAGPGDDLFDWQAGTIADELDRQVVQVEQWRAALDEVMARGLSVDAVDVLGLGSGPETLGQLKVLLRAGDDELVRLSESVAARQSAVDEQVAAERVDRRSELSRDIVALERTLTDDVRALRSEHAAAMREMETGYAAASEEARVAHHERLAELEVEFHERQRQLGEELAAIGLGNGRSYSDAVAAGIASGIPAVEAQVAAVKRLMREMKAAEAAAVTDAARVAAMRASMGLAPDAVSDRVWEDRLAAGTHGMAEVERRLREKAGTRGSGAFGWRSYDVGGVLSPGMTLAYNGTGQNEHVLTSQQLSRVVTGGSHGGSSVSVVVQGNLDQVTLDQVRQVVVSAADQRERRQAAQLAHVAGAG